MNKYDFGYPKCCDKCVSISKEKLELKVEPFYRESGKLKLMLIGQDPTIFNKPEKVKEVLMLNDTSSQLYRWLSNLFGKSTFENITIYATNMVKCSFKVAPSKQSSNISKFLEPYFDICKGYTISEIEKYKPNLVITLGEPAHKLFSDMLNIGEEGYDKMQKAYTGDFREVNINGLKFHYSPCLHIKTFRVAETYGDSVKKFKQCIKTYFDK